MRRLRVGLALTLSAAAVAPHTGQTAERPAQVIVLVDDYHIDFRATPRIRDILLKTVLPPLAGHVISLVTTGYSSVSVPPTTDAAALVTAVRSITGGSLGANDLIQQSQRGSAERIRRARIAVSTARQVIDALPVQANGTVMIYISGGYANVDLATDLAELAAAANQANVRIYTIDSRGVTGGPVPGVTQSNERAWTAYALEAQTSLRILAERTGGQLVSALSEIETVKDAIPGDLENAR